MNYKAIKYFSGEVENLPLLETPSTSDSLILLHNEEPHNEELHEENGTQHE